MGKYIIPEPRPFKRSKLQIALEILAEAEMTNEQEEAYCFLANATDQAQEAFDCLGYIGLIIPEAMRPHYKIVYGFFEGLLTKTTKEL